MQRFAFSLLAISGLCVASPYKADAATVVTRAENLDEAYDYVIIGGGTAGLTVADRLTVDGKTTVLVIEYGPLSKFTIQARLLGILLDILLINRQLCNHLLGPRRFQRHDGLFTAI